MLYEEICQKIFEFWEFSLASAVREEHLDALLAPARAQKIIDLLCVKCMWCGANCADCIVGNGIHIYKELLDSARQIALLVD